MILCTDEGETLKALMRSEFSKAVLFPEIYAGLIGKVLLSYG
jgi:hypothetical protein